METSTEIELKPLLADLSTLRDAVVQGWTLGKVLGRGADGIVYEGSKSGRAGAIKLFFRDALDLNGQEEAQQRLDIQLSLRGQKHHDNLVEIYDGGRTEELSTLFLAMELVPGKSLDKVINILPKEAIEKLLSQLVSAVRYLEEKHQLAHRDIKPANIVVSEDFTKLTLLDLGVVTLVDSEVGGRLSGDNFVATLRYSPPEFVWREEDASIEAWRAISFYQIGATLHDMVMRKELFSGNDRPKARLYDAVKNLSPVIDDGKCSPRLAHIAKCCLLKDWRERLKLVNWELFSLPESAAKGIPLQRDALRLRQLLRLEAKVVNGIEERDAMQTEHVHKLWELNTALFVEVRQFLMGEAIFPQRFSATQRRVSDSEYSLDFNFEKSTEQGFEQAFDVKVKLAIASHSAAATDIHVTISFRDGPVLFDGRLTEVLNVETSARFVEQALYAAVDLLIPRPD